MTTTLEDKNPQKMARKFKLKPGAVIVVDKLALLFYFQIIQPIYFIRIEE